MSWLARIFATALARRLAAVIVAGALATCGIGQVRAQSFDQCYSDMVTGAHPSDIRCPDRGTALAEANRLAAKLHTFPARPRPACTYAQNATSGWYTCEAPYNALYSYYVGRGFSLATQCPSGQVWNDSAGSCQKPCTSVERPPTTVPRSPLSGSLGCNTGCVVNYANNGDDTSTVTTTGAMCGPDFKDKCPTGTMWNGYMALCQPIEPSCPKGQVKKEGVCTPEGKCPDGMIAVQGTTPGAVQSGELYCKAEASECPAGTIKAPATGKCIPGEGQCAAGEARRENGTCGKDSDGDGKADEDDDNPDNDPEKESASGGDSCDVPPSCSGGAIACLQVKVQWRIDCNTRKVKNVSGGTCDTVPVCTGKDCDAMQYAQLMQQWRATCALEKMAKKGTSEEGSDGTDGNGNGVPDALEGTGEVSEVGDGAADMEASRKFGVSLSPSMLDRDNFFGGGSCPQPPTFKMMGATISGADFPYWCQAMSILRSLILIFGTYYALRILLGGSF